MTKQTQRLIPAVRAVLALACSAQPLTREPPNVRDDRRPDEPLTINLLGTPVQLSGGWEYNDERRDNFDLDRADARDRRVREHEVKLEARALIDERTQAL